MSKILQFPRPCPKFRTPEEIAQIEASFFDVHGRFRGELNADDEGFEIPHCNNCGYFQHDLHERYWCRLFKQTQWFFDPGCKDWSHWEFHQ